MYMRKLIELCLLYFMLLTRSFHIRCLSLNLPQFSYHRSFSHIHASPPQLRLERILSNRGLGSRAEVARIIQHGKVKIDGKVIRSGAMKFLANVIIEVDGVENKELPLLMLYHKPVGVLSTITDPYGRKNLHHVIEENQELRPYHPVGRLDADSSGLLLFSRDGDLTQHLLRPSSKIMREYDVVVTGHVQHDMLKSTLAAGVETADGSHKLDLMSSAIMYDDPASTLHLIPQPNHLHNDGVDDDIDEELLASSSKKLDDMMITYDAEGKYSRVTVACSEGKYRMVRRVLHNAGHSVLSLHRTRYGSIAIGSLPEGQVRACDGSETQWLYSLLNK